MNASWDAKKEISRVAYIIFLHSRRRVLFPPASVICIIISTTDLVRRYMRLFWLSLFLYPRSAFFFSFCHFPSFFFLLLFIHSKSRSSRNRLHHIARRHRPLSRFSMIRRRPSSPRPPSSWPSPRRATLRSHTRRIYIRQYTALFWAPFRTR